MATQQRGLTLYFNDGSRMSLQFPRQTDNVAAAQLKLENALKQRYMLFESEGTLMVVPFESVKYFQVYPAPEKIPGHTYVTGAKIVD